MNLKQYIYVFAHKKAIKIVLLDSWTYISPNTNASVQYLSQHNARDITVHTNKKPLQKMGLDKET